MQQAQRGCGQALRAAALQQPLDGGRVAGVLGQQLGGAQRVLGGKGQGAAALDETAQWARRSGPGSAAHKLQAWGCSTPAGLGDSAGVHNQGLTLSDAASSAQQPKASSCLHRTASLWIRRAAPTSRSRP